MTNPTPKQPPRRPTDAISNLQTHYKYLNQPSSRIPGLRVFDEEFNFIEQRSLDKVYNQPCDASALACNIDKNRFPDVLPPDNTRVKLKEIPNVEGSDFINANFIMGSDGNPKGYICTQGPMQNTVVDFWRMCWDHSIKVFAMLTKEVERGQEKSARYWPENTDPEKTVKHGNFQITLQDQVPEFEDLTKRIFKIKNLEEPNAEERLMLHLQYVGWPDHGIPPSTKHFLQLMDIIDNYVAQESGGSVGVHCSAGIGRTGTFCTIHINVHILREHFKKNFRPPGLNIVNTILLLRKQRPGMVQTKEQFLFCYRAILDEYVRLWREAKARKQKQDEEDAAKAQAEGGVPKEQPQSDSEKPKEEPDSTVSTTVDIATPVVDNKKEN